MKKILTLILCFAMLCTAFSNLAFATADTDNTFTAAFRILNAVDVLTEYDDTTVDPNKKVSRAEFSDSLAAVLQLGNDYSQMYYHDVSKGHYAYQAITALTEAGYMRGVGEGMFNPDGTMLNKHAVRVLLSALGYAERVNASQYPEAEVYSLASSLGLSNGISMEAQMSFRDMVILLKNMLIAPTLQIQSFQGGSNQEANAQYKQDKDATLLSILYNMHYVKNERVLGANGVSIYNDALREGYVQIGSRTYIQTLDDMESYLGSYVNYIYEGNIETDECKLIWVEKKNQDTELEIEITKNGAFNPATYELTYDIRDDKQATISLSRNVTVIYNGGFVTNVEDVLQLTNYRARIVKNQSGEYDVVIISDYSNFIVGAVNLEDGFIRNKIDNTTISLLKEDYTHYLLKDASGSDYPAASLQKGDVISVYKSIGSKYIRMVVSGVKISGIINEKGTDDNGKEYIIVDSKAYYPDKNFRLTAYEPGMSVVLSLDAMGQIAYIDNPATSFYTMYVIDANAKGQSFDSVFSVKSFNQDGKIVIYDTAAKFKVNGTTYKNGLTNTEIATIKNLISDQLVICKFNANGEITELETARDGGNLVVSSAYGHKYYRAVSTKLGKTSVIDGSTLIFSVPNDVANAEENQFLVRNKSQLGDWRTFNSQCYQFKGNDNGVEDIVVIKGFDWYGIGDTDSLFVITKVSKALNEEDEIVTVLSGYEGLSEKEYYCESGFNPTGVNVGDALLLTRNAKKEVTAISEQYNSSSAIGESTDSLAANRRMVVGYANDVVGDVVKLSYTDGSTVDEIFLVDNTPVLVVDTSRSANPVKTGSIADVNTYLSGDACKLVIHTYQMIQQLMIIYK